MTFQKKAGAAVFVVGALIWLYLLLSPERSLPLAAADGDYKNSCCGEISLRGGTLTFGNSQIDYVIERDKKGPYLLPSKFVGPSPPNGLLIDEGVHPLKMRLTGERPPSSITVIGYDNRYYNFSR